MPERHAFVISDRTGLTAEAMAHSLVSQFPDIDFLTETLPFIDTVDKARDLVRKIAETAENTGQLPLLFVTLVDDEIREIIQSSAGVVFDLFDTFIGPMEKELGCESSHSVGKSHGVSDVAEYTSRIAAVHFSLATDDGMETDHYRKADIILVGVSRCGKTPTSLYLSMHFGLFASNYPLTDRELQSKQLPAILDRYRDKLYGLTIDPFRLLQIRQERYAGESYSSIEACQREVAAVESIYRATRIPFINTTRMSIEEISATIMHHSGLKRKI
ncbi:MAG: kinase/pyrophosphorylase [Gammaproteobacteria bacterium]|nr:kinase/pyrophosphorylase [Gammaproteobacteria bacterium]